MSEDEETDFIEEVTRDEFALKPNDAADPPETVRKKVPPSIWEKYEIHSYRSAITILAESHPAEFAELCKALDEFTINKTMIRTAGGNESRIPKIISATLRPLGWQETVIQGDLVVQLTSNEHGGFTAGGKARPSKKKVREVTRRKYLDGHKIDYVKGRVAFDLEWNSKDQTFDRDLYAFSAFAQCGIVDVGVLVTRGTAMTDFIKGLGQALTKEGKPSFTQGGKPRPTSAKYGASTTWMGKLLYRLNAGRNGACPVLVIGITPACVTD